MKSLIRKLTGLGITPDTPTGHIDELKVINSIKIYGGIMVLVTGLLTAFILPDRALFITAAVVFHLCVGVLVLALNTSKKYALAKWIFVMEPAVVVLVVTAYFGVMSNIQYITLLCFLMFIYLFKSKQGSEQYLLWVYLTFSIVGLYIIYKNQFHFGDPTEDEIKTVRFAVFVLSTSLTVVIGLVLQTNAKKHTARTRETLEESQKDAVILQSISDTMEEAIFKSSIKTGFVFVNEAFAGMFGYDSKHEIMHTHPVNLYESKGDREALLSRIITKGKVVNSLLHYRRKDGSFFWGRLNCKKLTEGSEEFLIGTIVDVTPQQEQTEQLAESERQLKESQKLAKLGSWRMVPDTGDVVWSAECARIHGFLPEDEKDPFQLWISSLTDMTLEELQKGIQRGASMNRDFEFGSWFTSPGGDHKYLNYICRLDGQSAVPIWYGTVQDATELKNKELELISTQEFYQNILDNIPVESVLIDENRHYFYISKNAISDDKLRKWMIGKRNLDYAEYRSLEKEFVIERDRKFELAFQSDLTVRWEEVMKTKDGRNTYHLRNLVPIKLRYGHTERRFLIGYSFDINDIKTAQFRLERNNEELMKLNRELDRFVYSISHDLRAPIASVLGLNALAEECDDEEELMSILSMQREALDRLDRYIRDVIDYARNKRLDITATDIKFEDILNECLADLAYMTNYDAIEYFIEHEDACLIYTDRVRLKIIMNNLLSNAIKYCDLEKDNPYISIRCKKEGHELVIEVADNGIGIKDEFQPQIWEIFFRGISDIPGSGLGLYILKESIKNLKGSISLKSKEGEGTTFSLRIPDWKEG